MTVMHDVIISGAGPAGAMAAYECAHLGLDTVLVEKDSIPRKKCCAGGLLERAASILPFSLPSSVVEREIRGFSIVIGDYHREFDFDKRVGCVLRREAFDLYLAQMAEGAGAKVLQHSRIIGLEELPEKVVLRISDRELEGRLLIVAEGATGISGKSLLGQYPHRTLAMGRAVNIRTRKDPGDRIEIHLIDTPTHRLRIRPDFPLNGWMFPHKLGANVGVVGKDIGKERLESTLSQIVRSVEERFGPIEEVDDLRAHPLPFAPRRTLHGSRSMLVGDAAGLVNPITGEGMGYALASGRLAAQTAKEIIVDKRGIGHLASYDSRCAQTIIRDIKAAGFLSPYLHWLVGVVDTRHFFDNLHDDETLVTTCLRIARGEDDWRGLLARTIPKFPRLFFSSLGPQKRLR
jgi:geranylgeranyl reductase family protein